MLSKKTTCKHDNLELTLGGFFCPECRRRFGTAIAADANPTVRREATDTTAVLHAILPRLESVEREQRALDAILEGMEGILTDLGYVVCSTRGCVNRFKHDPGNLVEGLPYCDVCYPKVHAKYTAGEDSTRLRIMREVEKEGPEQPHITAEAVRKTADQLLSTEIVGIEEPQLACSTWGCQNSFPNNGGNEIDGKRLCDRCYEKELGNVECRSAPMWAWDVIDECLQLDAVGNASDKELRDSVQRAIDAMTVETAWNSNIAGKES